MRFGVLTESGSHYLIDSATRTVTRTPPQRKIDSQQAREDAVARARKKWFQRNGSNGQVTGITVDKPMKWRYLRMEPPMPIPGQPMQFHGKDGMWVSTEVSEVVER